MENKKNDFKVTVDGSRNMKPFCSIETLIEKLSTAEINPLSFTEDERTIAKEFFTYTNYYSFSVYRKYLPIVETKQYSFSDCLVIYEFNRFLRAELSRITGQIELMLKSSFLKSLCENYSGTLQKGECYLDRAIYSSDESYEEEIIMMNRRIQDRRKTLPIAHHLQHKDGKIPFWVMVPEFTFGEMTGFISAVNVQIKLQWLRDSFLSMDRVNVSIYGDEYVKKFFGWFSSAWYIRNVCAHYGRLYGANFNVASPSFFSEDYRKIKKYGKLKTHNRDLLLIY